MESLAPPLEFCLELRRQIESGESARAAIKRICIDNSSPFLREVSDWVLAIDRGLPREQILRRQTSPYRREFLMTLAMAFEGEPIVGRLEELENEMVSACQDELERHLQKLPVLALVPLLFFQFPAFLLLLLGPIYLNLLQKI